jgi:hypothetical protein
VAADRLRPTQQESALSDQLPPDPRDLNLARARRADCARTITEALADDLKVFWVFCTWCGHTHLIEPHALRNSVEGKPDALDELECRLLCSKCRRRGCKIIPTDRASISFDRMGTSARKGR